MIAASGPASDVMACSDQLSNRVRADVASTPGDEHVHAQHPMGIGHTPRRCAVHYAHGVSSSPTAPFVRVVVINYDGGAVTRRCVDSLLATEYPADRLQVVVVDNGGGASGDLPDDPRVELVVADRNGGFGAAANVGIRRLLAAGADEGQVLLAVVIEPERGRVTPGRCLDVELGCLHGPIPRF